MKLKKEKLAYAATILSLFGISFSAPLGSLAVSGGVAPVVVGMYRMVFSIPMTSLIWLILFRRDNKDKKSVAKASPKHKLINILSGVFLALHFTCWYYALANTTVFSAAALVSLQPIFAMLGAFIVFRQKPSKSIVLPLFIAILGSFVLVLPSIGEGSSTLSGNLVAALGSLFMAAYLMCGKFAMKKISLGGYTTVAYSVCFAVMAAIAWLTGASFILPTNIIFICLLLSICATLFGHTLINWSLPYVGAFFVTVVLLGEPIGASLAAFFMFGTVPGLLELLGGLMTIAGIAIMVVRANRKILSIKA